MDLTFSEEQEMLRDSVAQFMRREAPPAAVAQAYQYRDGYDPEVLRRAAEPGWLGLLIPEEYGGQGGTLTDGVVAFEEFGRGAIPAPMFSAGILAPALIEAAGSKEWMERLLPKIAVGQLIATFAGPDAAMGWGPDLVETELTKSGSGFVLNGTKHFVLDAEPAGTFLCLARTAPQEEGVTLVIVDRASPGVSLRRHEGLLASVAEVKLDSVQVDAGAVLGEMNQGWSILEAALDRVLLVLSAFKVGACQQVFDATVQYTHERIAFGQPIGRFQRVQDHVVELADHLDAARLTTYEALWKLESGQPAKAAVHQAKAVASEGYYEAVNYAHMVHAGPGTALEHPLFPHTYLSRTLYQYLGNPAYHKRRMMDALFPHGV